MTRKEFSEWVAQLRYLNPLANIGTNNNTTRVIWSEVEAKELTLPPMTKYCGDTADHQGILKYSGYTILVRQYGYGQ